MKIKYGKLAWALLLLAPALLCARQSENNKNPAASSSYIAFVGTYTDKTASKGIYSFRYDPATGKMTPLGVAAETANPSWLAVHPNGQFLYAANESGKDSTLSAFRIDSATGKLTLLNQTSALGEDPCYISFDRTGKYILVANYTSGNVVVFPISANGKIGVATANVHDEGKLGPNKERQEAPHAHWVETSADNRVAYVADLGLDRVIPYEFDAAEGSLTLDKPILSERMEEPRSVRLAPAVGPRHAVFSADGKALYVLGELQSNVTAIPIPRVGFAPPELAPSRSGLASGQVISALPAKFSGRNDAAEIAIDATGTHLYTSNRGHESIAVFAIEQKTGKLTKLDDTPTGGKEPRHFAMDPGGKFLLAENQLSDNIVEFRVDPATGKLDRTGTPVSVPSPVCLVFVPEK